MHHSIWVEHDGSWTWSIEEGKAFEDGHKVLSRDEGFPTRGDAKEDMQKAWARLLSEGKKPRRVGQVKTTTKQKTKTASKKTTNGAKISSQEDSFSSTLPEWAVIVNGTIVAMFANKTTAQKYAKSNHEGEHRLQKLKFGGVAG